MRLSHSLIAKLFGVALFTAILWSPSCKEDPAFLLAGQKTRIDTVSANQIKLLKPVLDSLCDQNFDMLVNRAKDSIMIVRKEEIRKILNK